MPAVVPTDRFHKDRFPVTPEQFGAIGDGVVDDTNHAVLYSKDNGSGKTQLVVRFPTGAVQVLATEP